MYNFYPADCPPEGPVAPSYVEDPFLHCSCWLRNILGLPTDPAEELPAEYCDDPFILGFAHGFALAYSKDYGGCNLEEDPHEAFALDIFETVFGVSGQQRHELAKRLRQFKHKDYDRGADNGQWFFVAYRHEVEYLQHPGVAEAIRRAAALVPSRTTAKPGSEKYQLWFRSAEDCALYDVLFLDIVRSRFPNLVEWRGSALETMADPTLGWDEEWPSLDDAPELRGMLAFAQPAKG